MNIPRQQTNRITGGNSRIAGVAVMIKQDFGKPDTGIASFRFLKTLN